MCGSKLGTRDWNGRSIGGNRGEVLCCAFGWRRTCSGFTQTTAVKGPTGRGQAHQKSSKICGFIGGSITRDERIPDIGKRTTAGEYVRDCVAPIRHAQSAETSRFRAVQYAPTQRKAHATPATIGLGPNTPRKERGGLCFFKAKLRHSSINTHVCIDIDIIP